MHDLKWLGSVVKAHNEKLIASIFSLLWAKELIYRWSFPTCSTNRRQLSRARLCMPMTHTHTHTRHGWDGKRFRQALYISSNFLSSSQWQGWTAITIKMRESSRVTNIYRRLLERLCVKHANIMQENCPEVARMCEQSGKHQTCKRNE